MRQLRPAVHDPDQEPTQRFCSPRCRIADWHARNRTTHPTTYTHLRTPSDGVPNGERRSERRSDRQQRSTLPALPPRTRHHRRPRPTRSRQRPPPGGDYDKPNLSATLPNARLVTFDEQLWSHSPSGSTVTKLDRLAQSLPDARTIAEDLTRRQVKLSLGRSVYDPTDPVGRLLFNVLAMVAVFEADLVRARTREGMRVAKAKGHLRGKQPKLKPRQGSPPGRTAPQRRIHHRRSRRPVRRGASHCLPDRPTPPHRIGDRPEPASRGCWTASGSYRTTLGTPSRIRGNDHGISPATSTRLNPRDRQDPRVTRAAKETPATTATGAFHTAR